MSTLLDDLKRSRDETLALFRSDPAALARSYAPAASGKWNLRTILVHLADAETVLLDRLRRLQADDKPLLWAYDENRWVAHLDYAHRDLAVAAALFAATRAAVIELATLIPQDRNQRAGVHSEAGAKTFAQVLALVPWHNLHHLEQARACVAGATWTAAG